MPILLKPGDVRRGYTIVRTLNAGAFAQSYEARSATGMRVFLKQYKSPTRRVDWFDDFVQHGQELKRRINSDPAAKERCYRFIDFFEERDFYQVFEFIEGNTSLRHGLETDTAFTWEQHALFAKVMMFGISALHRIGVVHSDLKPDNIILIPDETVSIGYRLRIIDMDWAIFSDRRAPWHGKQGYVGTPGYQSPEHLRGDVPTPASDVFTCGLMLGQLLGGRHPFQEAIDRDTYSAAVLDGEFEPIHINKPIDRVPDIRAVEDILNACLAIDPTTRPTAAQVADGLIGKAAESSRPSVHGHPPGGPTMAATKGAPKVPAGGAVELWFGGRRVTSVSIDSALGRRHFIGVDPDARFLSEPQFRLFQQSGRWHIEPSPGTANETVVDGRRLEHAEPVSEGMQVAVGNTTKGVTRFPLELRIVAKQV